MAVYVPTDWTNDSPPPLSAANLNKLTNELKAQATARSIVNTLPTWADGTTPSLTDATPLAEMERVAQAVAVSLGLSYTPTAWQAGWVPPRDAAAFDKLEAQAQANRSMIDAPVGTILFDGGPLASGAAAGGCPPWNQIHAQQQSGLTNTPRFQRVTSQGRTAWQCEVRQGDFAQWTNGREVTFTQINSVPNIGLGQDNYVGWSMFIPTNYTPTNVGGDSYGNNFVEWHGTSQEQAPTHFGANGANGQYFIDLHTQASGWNPVFTANLGPLIKGQWVDYVLRTKWSTGTDGVYEFWIDGTKVWSWTGRTWTFAGGTIYPQIGHYRSPTSATVILLYSDYRIGTTYSVVAPANY